MWQTVFKNSMWPPPDKVPEIAHLLAFRTKVELYYGSCDHTLTSAAHFAC